MKDLVWREMSMKANAAISARAPGAASQAASLLADPNY